MSAKGKVLSDNAGNRDIINSLGEIIDGDIRPGDGQKFLEWYVSQLDDIGDLNGKYFSEIEKAKNIGDFVNNNRTRLLKLLGYDSSKGTIKSGSFLFTLIDFSDLYNQLQQQLIGSIFTQQPLDIKGMKDFVLGDKKAATQPTKETVRVINHSGGAVEAALNTKTFDSFQQYDRTLQKSIATDLGLKYAIYQGGLIKTSRDFCIERNDRVFTSEEIELFGTKDDRYGGYTNKATGDFDGKDDPYNPFISLGGFGCRHSLDFLSLELGEILYKEQNNRAVPLDV
jgi:hypothetical protein